MARSGLRPCGHREREAAQVLDQAAGVRTRVEPRGQRCGVVGRSIQTARTQQIEQGRRAQAAVEVIVQQHLGQRARPCRVIEGMGRNRRHRCIVVQVARASGVLLSWGIHQRSTRP
jgi:transposase